MAVNDDLQFAKNTDPDYVMALRRTGHVAVSRGRLILVWGGHRERYSHHSSRYLPVEEIWVYDTLLETWSLRYTQGTYPPGTSGAAVFMFDNKMYVFGGYCDERSVQYGNSNAMHMLDLASLHWHQLDCKGKLPLPCDKLASWEHDGKLFVFGGFGLNPQLEPSFPKKNFEFVPDDSSQMVYPRGWNNQLVAFDPNSHTWTWPTYKGKPPAARAAHASAKLGNVVYVCGGRHKEHRMNDMHCLNLLDMTWSDHLPVPEPMPEGRSWHSLTPLNSTSLVLYGGFSQDQNALDDCWLFDVLNLSWCEIKLRTRQPRLWHAACSATAGEIAIIGGCSDNILSHYTQRNYADVLVILSFTPKSLLRLCLDAAILHKSVHSLWCTLPVTLQAMLKSKMCAR